MAITLADRGRREVLGGGPRGRELGLPRQPGNRPGGSGRRLRGRAQRLSVRRRPRFAVASGSTVREMSTAAMRDDFSTQIFGVVRDVGARCWNSGMDFSGGMEALSGAELLDSADALAREIIAAEARLLVVAAQWAVLNGPETVDPGQAKLPGRQSLQRFGGSGDSAGGVVCARGAGRSDRSFDLGRGAAGCRRPGPGPPAASAVGARRGRGGPRLLCPSRGPADPRPRPAAGWLCG